MGEKGPDAYIIPTLTPHILKITKGESRKEKYLGRYDAYHMYQISNISHQALKYSRYFNIFCLRSACSVLTLTPGKPHLSYSVSPLVCKIEPGEGWEKASDSEAHCDVSSYQISTIS